MTNQYRCYTRIALMRQEGALTIDGTFGTPCRFFFVPITVPYFRLTAKPYTHSFFTIPACCYMMTSEFMRAFQRLN